MILNLIRNLEIAIFRWIDCSLSYKIDFKNKCKNTCYGALQLWEK